MKKNQKNILIILLLVIIFFTGIFFYSNYLKVKNVIVKENQSEISKESAVTFTVLDKIYQVSIKEGGTIYDVMNTLQSNKENNFTFEFKDYPSMGIFIDGINGIKGEKNKYWFYSVNGQEASVSVSNYILKNGDSILWEQKSF